MRVYTKGCRGEYEDAGSPYRFPARDPAALELAAVDQSDALPIDGNRLTQYEWLRQLNSTAAVDQSETLGIAFRDSFRIAAASTSQAVGPTR